MSVADSAMTPGARTPGARKMTPGAGNMTPGAWKMTPGAGKMTPAPRTTASKCTPAPRKSKLTAPSTYAFLATGALAAGAVTYVAVVDPHRPDSLYPPCPFKLLTGWNCPACGGLRMAHDLLHGHLAQAAMDNVFLLVAIPALLGWILYRRRAGSPPLTRAVYIAVAVAALIWTVARNMPGFPLVPTVYPG